MKIKNIAAICKKSKTVVLLNREIEDGGTVEQYIGDDAALYSVAGIPLLE